MNQLQRKATAQPTKQDNSILALCIVSESELAAYIKDYDCSIETNNPEVFREILQGMGIDTTRQVERQDGLQHRNRLNQVVICSRWVGYERTDAEWITSGYASQTAKDKASGSRLLEDLYRARGLTEDAQSKQEARDVHTTIDESVQE